MTSHAFFENHPHPILHITSEGKIQNANLSAMAEFGEDIEKRSCCDVVFRQEAPCVHRCLECVKGRPYHTFHAGIKSRKRDAQREEFYVTLFPGGDGTGCFMSIHPVPLNFERIRVVRDVAQKITVSESTNEVLENFRDFLTSSKYNTWRRPYRVREYGVDDPREPRRLTLRWHDVGIEEDRPYVEDIDNRIIEREGRAGPASFFAIDHSCLVLVTPNEDDLKAFTRSYEMWKDGDNTWSAAEERFANLRLYRLTETDQPVSIFCDATTGHCWLDVAFGMEHHVLCKTSITPQGRLGHFSREEMEAISTLHAVANAQIANLEARAAVARSTFLDIAHDAIQPATSALQSIEWLRQRFHTTIAERPQTDVIEAYAMERIEHALRVLVFLIEGPRIKRDKPAFYTPKANLLAEVIGPVIDMFRHEQVSRRFRLDHEPTWDDLGPASFDADATVITLGEDAMQQITVDGKLSQLDVFIDPRRLQQVFYNLIRNALSYGRSGEPISITLSLVAEDDITDQSLRKELTHFRIIDVRDNGIGITEDERTYIFEHGVRGSAAHNKTGGYGHGLHIVREIALSFGGDIYVANLIDPTCFRLFVPVACESKDWTERLRETRAQMNEIRNALFDKMPKLFGDV